MSKRRNHGAAGGRQWNITLPATLASRIDAVLMDPVTKKPGFGKRSKLVTNLLMRWLQETEEEIKAHEERQAKEDERKGHFQ